METKRDRRNTIIAALIIGGATIVASLAGAWITSGYRTTQVIQETGIASWKRLYEHDSNGTKIEGSKDELREAIEKGYPIKIVVIEGERSSHIFDAEWLWVEGDKITTQNTSQITSSTLNLRDPQSEEISQPPDLSPSEGKQLGARRVILLVDTSGRYQLGFRYVKGFPGPTRDHLQLQPTEKRRMAWFGLVPPG